jgi:hypothetical protein
MRLYQASPPVSRPFYRATRVALTAAMLVTMSANAQAANPCIDVALVIAVDGSGSVDASEYALQQRGIASALRDHDVQHAIAAAGTVGITVLFWGSAGQPVQETDWVMMRGHEDAERLARLVEAQPRKVGGFTGLGAALRAALGKLSTLQACTDRSIINVSGDGRDTLVSQRQRAALAPEEVRADAEARGITINGLVISNEEPGIADYYAGRVITGPGAFVITIADYTHFAEALRRKLIREIGPLNIGLLTHPLAR